MDTGLIKKEMTLLTQCGLILNGYSKTFRNLWAEKPQAKRIAFLEGIVNFHAEYESGGRFEW